MNTELSPTFLNQICGNAKAEFCLYNPRSKTGIQTWEIKVRNTDNTRKIIVAITPAKLSLCAITVIK